MSRKFLPVGLFLAALVPLLFVGPRLSAQEEDVKKISFKTSDEVSLQGTLYKSKGKNPTNGPCVILLHQPGLAGKAGDWAGLAKTLAEKGFNVLDFDFRGTGESTLINPNAFWKDPVNATMMQNLARKKPQPGKLNLADYKTKETYYPKLAEDVMAARIALDQLNDNLEVNTSSVYLVGAGDAATIGMLYLAAEWFRSQKLPPALVGPYPALAPRLGGPIVGGQAAGVDVAGAIWLSPSKPTLGTVGVTTNNVNAWLDVAPEMRERTPMLFLYGDGDDKGKSGANFFRNDVLKAQPNPGSPLQPLKLTRSIAIDKTRLTGAELLGKKLKTEDLIGEYLTALDKERANMIRQPNRAFPTPPPIDLRQFGVCK